MIPVFPFCKYVFNDERDNQLIGISTRKNRDLYIEEDDKDIKYVMPGLQNVNFSPSVQIIKPTLVDNIDPTFKVEKTGYVDKTINEPIKQDTSSFNETFMNVFNMLPGDHAYINEARNRRFIDEQDRKIKQYLNLIDETKKE